ncbi:MAG: magnesium transporter [Clostridia bacterium]|nr:magnesium transporter [Clostridia bacterium]
MATINDYAPDFELLREMLEEKQLINLKKEISDMNEVDIAVFMEELDSDKALIVFRLLNKDLASEVFACLSSDTQEHIITSISDTDLHFMIEDLFVDDVVDLLEELPATVVKRILRIATPQTRNLINQFLRYPDDSAGSIMTAEYVALKKTMTVSDAINYIRKTGVDKETIYTCYVTGPQRFLEGIVSLKDLIMSSPDCIIEEIMDTNVIKCVTTEEQEEIIQTFNKYDLLALPVVDHENRIVGIITVDDVFDVMEEETTEDMEKMAAITPSEKPYLKTGVFETFKQRIPWLLILMISAAFTGQILTAYESALASCIILTSFIPMLMNTGGNSGSQSSVTVIRGLSIGEIEFKDIFKVLGKEFLVSILCGIVLALANLLKLILIDRIAIEIAVVVCLTLLITVIAAKIVGCLLPMVAKKIGFDPAVMANPFITTIVDALSLVIFFNIATYILGI